MAMQLGFKLLPLSLGLVLLSLSLSTKTKSSGEWLPERQEYLNKKKNEKIKNTY